MTFETDPTINQGDLTSHLIDWDTYLETANPQKLMSQAGEPEVSSGGRVYAFDTPKGLEGDGAIVVMLPGTMDTPTTHEKGEVEWHRILDGKGFMIKGSSLIRLERGVRVLVDSGVPHCIVATEGLVDVVVSPFGYDQANEAPVDFENPKDFGMDLFDIFLAALSRRK